MGKKQLSSSEYYTSIFNAINYGLIAVDMEGSISLCNELALEHLDVQGQASEVVDKHFSSVLKKVPVIEHIIQNRLSSERNPFDVLSIPISDKILNIRGRIVPHAIVITTEDVTHFKKQEQVNLKALLQRQETDRRRLAQDIHDGIGPVMSAVILHLDAIKSDFSAIPPNSLKKIEIMGELIHEAADSIRSISHALMPGALVDLGIAAALDNLCRKANESEKIQVNFYQSGLENRLHINLALGLYRIAQELLNNAFKHARASIINVQLIKHPESILLMVEDDGVGIDKAIMTKLMKKGIGLRNVQTRVKALNGQFNIDTFKNKGMIATVEIPVKPKK